MKTPKKNEQYTVNIIDFTSEGFGVCKIDGFAVFVENTTIGDVADIIIVKVKKTYGYGKLMKLLSPSEKRVTETCEYSKACGGCTMQHIAYEEQMRIKTKIVDDCFKRIGGFTALNVNDAIGSEKQFRYRNKGQFPISTENGELVWGFFAKRSHRIVPLRDCFLQSEKNKIILESVLSFMNKNNITAYDETTHTGVVRHVVTRISEKTNEIMVTIVINDSDLENSEEIIKSLINIEGVKSICVSVNREKTNVIMGKKIKILYGEGFITDYIGISVNAKTARFNDSEMENNPINRHSLAFRISSQSFFQVNPWMTEWMYNEVIKLAQIKSTDVVIDCYCGIGSISLYAAKFAKKVIGIEIIPSAIKDANENALLNNIDNAEFILGSAEDELTKLAKDGFNADVIIIDPPRGGCDDSLLSALASISPDRIIYVSCNPATLARDLKCLMELSNNKYQIKTVQPFDMFCNTMGVESITLLHRI